MTDVITRPATSADLPRLGRLGTLLVEVHHAFDAQRFLPTLGPKPFMMTGATFVVIGLVWQSLITPDSSYADGVLGPMLVFGFGRGLNFVTVTVTAVSGVAQHEAGAASGLLNATHQVGGSLGLSILTTVFGSASKDEAKKQLPKFLANGSPEQKAEFAKTHQLPAPWGHEVLAHGISEADQQTINGFVQARFFSNRKA
jgi:hypothetical protein